MAKAFDRIKAGLEDAIEYARGDMGGRRIYRIPSEREAPTMNVRRDLRYYDDEIQKRSLHNGGFEEAAQ